MMALARPKPIVFLRRIASPIMIPANPNTIIPVPPVTSAKFWYWASKAPDKATSPLDRDIPKNFMVSTLILLDLTIVSLSPVARNIKPVLVLKKANKSSPTQTLITTRTNKVNGIIVNTESVFNKAILGEPDMILRLME